MVRTFGDDRFESVISDPAGLRCPRFAGDRDLAAVLAGRLRLAAPRTRPVPAPVRSRGPAVQKVQEVLIAAGYPLPRFGADGRFGPETGRAVSRFKQARGIQPKDPVVGPKTIRALDATCVRPPPECGSLEGVRVAVIGGGFAGLMAAWSLHSGGTRVTLFEASGRLGGRVRTDRTLIPGKIAEAGAELIGTNHPTWIKLARSFGLTLTKVTKYDYKDTRRLVRLRFGDTDLSVEERERLDRDLQPVLEQIGRDAKKVDPLQPWKSPDAAALDAKSVEDRFNENDMFGLASSVARKYLEFILENDQCAPPSRQSYLGLLTAVRAHAMGSDMLGYWNCTETHRCAGGNEQLATHLAKGLRDVRLDAPVVCIDIKSGSIRVEFSRKSATASEEFDYVVLATPPAAWPKINSAPPFRPQDYTIAHGPAVKFLSTFSRKFWEDDKLAPSALWDRIGSVWEGTDKQDRLPGGFGLTVYSGGQYVLDASTYETRMKTIYPKYGANVKRKLFVNWPIEPWICSGYAIPAPGQVTTVTRNLSVPYLGRLFFAGEQASPGFFGYMEGALQSGVFAAYRIAAAVRAACRSGAATGAAGTRRAGDSSDTFAESVIGPCADVPVPPSARPRLLVRGSVHPAVRDAQRRLNVIHLREVTAGRAGLVNAPLQEDCLFGGRTFNAVLSFQRLAFAEQPSEHDGKIGPKTWAKLDMATNTPGPPPPTPPPPPATGLVELRADYDRDGKLSGSKKEYAARLSAPGAILAANLDRDGRRLPARVSSGANVSLDIDASPKSAADSDPIPLSVRVAPSALTRFSSILLRVSGGNAGAVSMLDDRGRPVPPSRSGPGVVEFPLPLQRGSHTRSLEGTRVPGSPLGVADPSLKLVVVGIDAASTETELDRANLRLAPFLVLDDLRPATRLYICDLPENQPSLLDVRAGLSAAQPRPELVTVPSAVANGDAWLQDQFQVGFLAAAGRSMLALLHLPRLRSNTLVVPGQPNLASFIRSHYPSTDLGLIEDYWQRRIPLVHQGGTAQLTFEGSQEVDRILHKLRTTDRELRDELDRMCDEAKAEGISTLASCTNIPPRFSAPSIVRLKLDDLLARVRSLVSAISAKNQSKAAGVQARLASLEALRRDVDRVISVSGTPGNETFELALASQPLRFTADQLVDVAGIVTPLHDSLVYGGNVEASPPMDGLPFGKVVLGESDTRPMDPQLRALFEANSALQPLVTIDTAWLGVGHVDELMTFLPDRRKRSVILRASHEVAFALLLEAINRYRDGLPNNHPDSFFNWRPLSTVRHRMTAGAHPVTRLLRGKHWRHHHPPNPSDILLPPAVYRRISTFYEGPLSSSEAPFTAGPSADDRHYLAALTAMDYRFFFRGDQLEFLDGKMRDLDQALADSFPTMRILRVPVLFDWADLNGGDTTAAFTPNLVNQQFVNGACFIPNPIGIRMRPADATDIIRTVLKSEHLDDAHSRVGPRWLTQNRLDITEVWVNGDGQEPTSRLASTRALAEEFKDGFPGKSSDEIAERIARANPPAFTTSGTLRAGWWKVVIPEGTVDLFQAYTHAVIDSLGAKPRWVDSWSYHVSLGEIHCGTNVLRTPPTTPRWWTTGAATS